MGRPVPAPAGLGDSLNVTALEAPPPLGPVVVPTPLRLHLGSILRRSRRCLAPIHRAPVPLAWSEEPAWPFKSLGPQQLSPEIFLRLLFVSFSALPLFLSPSCTVWFIQQDSTPSGFVQEPNSTCVFLFFRDWEVLINIFEDFETSS